MNIQKLSTHVEKPVDGNECKDFLYCAYMYSFIYIVDIKNMKNLMEKIESNVLVFKESQKEAYDLFHVYYFNSCFDSGMRLLYQEAQLTNELQSLQDRIALWDVQSQPLLSFREKIVKNPLVDNSNSLPQVLSFSKYLSKYGGQYGGWDDLSHFAFLKFRGRHVNKMFFYFSNVIIS